MDFFHREILGKDTPTGPECQFCYRADPNFSQREPMDRLVASQLDNTAAAHLTEDGYIKHRIAELIQKRDVPADEMELLKSA
jgi:hypothetical protein